MKCAAATALVLLMASACAAQATPPNQPEMPWDPKKYPGLLDEFGQLAEKLLLNVQFPAARGRTRLLPLLPESTMSYAAFPNYGDAAHQTLKIFRQELQESEVLRDWWQHGKPAKVGPKVEDALEKFYQLSQYLGEEVVVSGAMEGKDASLLILVEVRKPGLKEFLQRMVKELAGESRPAVRVLDLQELATAEERRPAREQLEVLVRPDYVVGALDLATLRSFNARLEGNSRKFASTPFGQRVAQAYEGGTTILAAADLKTLLDQLPPGSKQNPVFQRTGFADVKYAVWEHKGVAGQAGNQAELSFTGPRHGVASWLAAPAPLGSLDFASPKALLAATVVLKTPALIFDDIRALVTSDDPKAFAALEQSEEALKLNLKEDLLKHLGGEITFELDDITLQGPVWKAMLRVNDPTSLQRTLKTLLAAAQLGSEESVAGGVTYSTVRIPASGTSFEIDYAFVDGYLIVASSHGTAAEAVRMHRSGESLGKSKKFLAALPPGHSSGASALFYQDPMAIAALSMRLRAAPGMGGLFANSAGESEPAVICIYGEETAIREATSSAAYDAGVVLVVAAIAIPNLLRARIAANEASAVGKIRTVNTAQVSYAAAYPQRGYAPDLATLGPDPGGGEAGSADHADLIDATLGNAGCVSGAWCEATGFRFSLTAVCTKRRCQEYVVVGTPVTFDTTGGRSFCSTSDGVIRFKKSPVTSLLSVSECRAWSPIQ